MTILAATYIELILKDFFDSFFTTKPFELLKLLAENDSAQKRILGAVSIQKILDNTARDAMAEHAFNTMQNEDMWGIIRKLAKRTPIKSDWKLLFHELHSLITQRNSIVHNTLPDDSDKNQADIQKIYNYYDLLIKFLIVLEQIAQKNNIPYWKDLEYSDSSPVT